MQMHEHIRGGENMVLAALARAGLLETVKVKRASLLISHKRPTNFLKDEATGLYTIPDPESYKRVDDDELVWNQKTNVGIVQLHTQGYATGSILTNGFNYIALMKLPRIFCFNRNHVAVLLHHQHIVGLDATDDTFDFDSMTVLQPF